MEAQALKLDAGITPSGDFPRDLQQIKLAERLGFDAAWLSASGRNPFLPLTLAAKETSAIRLATLDEAAFPRSPMVTAQIAWDLARQSDGGFMLGLSAQDEERDSQDQGDRGGRMREYIESLRAIWDAFQTDARLRYRGKHYQFRLMAPFFNPGPIAQPAIPIFLASGDPAIWRLAAETCAGLHISPLHTSAWLREVVKREVDAGLKAAGRRRSDFEVAASVFVISGASERERQSVENAARARLALLASQPENRLVMRWLGWANLAAELQSLARRRRWTEMTEALPADLLRQLAVIARPHEVFEAIVERYGGIADRLCLQWNDVCPAPFEAIARSRVQAE